MSWQASVTGLGDQLMPEGCCGVGGWFCRPSTAPVSGSAKRRTSFTISAAAGLPRGTLMTSMRQRDGFTPAAGLLLQPAMVEAGRTPAVPETYTYTFCGSSGSVTTEWVCE